MNYHRGKHPEASKAAIVDQPSLYSVYRIFNLNTVFFHQGQHGTGLPTVRSKLVNTFQQLSGRQLGEQILKRSFCMSGLVSVFGALILQYCDDTLHKFYKVSRGSVIDESFSVASVLQSRVVMSCDRS